MGSGADVTGNPYAKFFVVVPIVASYQTLGRLAWGIKKFRRCFCRVSPARDAPCQHCPILLVTTAAWKSSAASNCPFLWGSFTRLSPSLSPLCCPPHASVVCHSVSLTPSLPEGFWLSYGPSDRVDAADSSSCSSSLGRFSKFHIISYQSAKQCMQLSFLPFPKVLTAWGSIPTRAAK